MYHPFICLDTIDTYYIDILSSVYLSVIKNFQFQLLQMLRRKEETSIQIKKIFRKLWTQSLVFVAKVGEDYFGTATPLGAEISRPAVTPSTKLLIIASRVYLCRYILTYFFNLNLYLVLKFYKYYHNV